MKIRGRRFSSTKIRKLIAEGKLAEAARFLGRPYSLYGKVVKGAGRGKTLGYSTANLKPYHEAIPPKGVYAVKVFLQRGQAGKHPQMKNHLRDVFEPVPKLGILNIGNRPTFEKKKDVVIEAHLLGYQGNLYGKRMEVLFLKRIRPERKFPTEEALLSRIRLDEKEAKRFAATYEGQSNLPART
jgi:riboflavin kinase/FMN adenylyltransferase